MSIGGNPERNIDGSWGLQKPVETKLCRNCVFWSRNTPTELIPTIDERYGKCACPKLMYDPKNFGFRTIPQGNDLLVYKDYEGWEASFITGEDFGCVHFMYPDNEVEEKE